MLYELAYATDKPVAIVWGLPVAARKYYHDGKKCIPDYITEHILSCPRRAEFTRQGKANPVYEDYTAERLKIGSRKWNRKQSNFVWRKFLTLLERKCGEWSFTSIIGKYKYRWMHKTSIHESAAFVIGRCGLGYNEAVLTGLQVRLADLKEFVGT